jgi:hypothetical protein
MPTTRWRSKWKLELPGRYVPKPELGDEKELSPRSDNKVEIVLILSENRLPLSPPVHYMIPSIRIFYSQRSGHNPSFHQTMSQAWTLLLHIC